MIGGSSMAGHAAISQSGAASGSAAAAAMHAAPAATAGVPGKPQTKQQQQQAAAAVDGIALEGGEKMPTDKLLDVSPLALRMSSPFNSGYWLSAA